MSARGFNIKVRQVANGYTVHRTTIPGGNVPEDHDDHVAMDVPGLRFLLSTMVHQEIECLEPAPEPDES